MTPEWKEMNKDWDLQTLPVMLFGCFSFMEAALFLSP